MAKHPVVSVKIGDLLLMLSVDDARSVADQIHKAIGYPLRATTMMYRPERDPYMDAVALRADIARRTF